MKMYSPKVSIIILNWNTWKDTIECLDSVFHINYSNFNIVLIDNGSNDKSVEKISQYCSGDLDIKSESEKNRKIIHPINFVKLQEDDLINYYWDNFQLNSKYILIENRVNYGFTKGNNIGIKFVLDVLKSDYVLLLNNDTIVKADFLDELIKEGIKDEIVGFLGPKIYFYQLQGRKDIIQYAGSRQNMWLFHPENIGIFEIDHGQYDQIVETDYIHGSCILAKVEMIKDVGLLDEDYFSYREENDWAIRGYKKGWKSLYVPKSVIWHKGGRSSGGNLSPLTVYYMSRNNFLLIKKNGNIAQIFLYYVYFFIYKFWYYSVVYLFYHKNKTAYSSFIHGAKDGILWKKTK